MNRQQAELYQRIQTFSLDEADTALPFSHRLAQENGWSLEYTSRVIEEYKKFVFLAAISDHPVTPSDQVDQVWHLHLLYTRSYWEEFCPKVLQKPLHHGPTKGGTWERQKFNDWYNKTLKSYEQFFNQPPPSDIWHPAHIRFGRDTRFTRVNTEQNWIIPKPDCQWIATLYANPFMILGLVWIMVFSSVAWAVAAPPIQASSHWLNPFRYAVPDFFFFCLLVGVTGFVTVRVLEWRLWRMNERSFIPPMVMAGFCLVPFGLGMGKLIAELSNLVAWEFLSLFALSAVAGGLLDQAFQWGIRRQLRRMRQTSPQTSLAAAGGGLLNRPVSQSLAAIALQITLFAIAGLYTTGLIRIAIGLSRNKPIGYLVFLCVLVGVYLIWRLQISFRNQQLPLLKGLTDLLYFILWLTLVPLGLFGIFVFVQIFGVQGLLATIIGSLLLFCLIAGQKRTSRSGSSGRRICGSDCGQCSSTSGNSGCGSGDGGGDAGCGGCGGCGE